MTGNRSGATTVYAASLLTGLTVVAYPASSTVLRNMHGLSDEAYGSLFLPQMALTILGSLLGSLLGAATARRLGLRVLLALSMGANTLSAIALLAVVFLPSRMALPTLLLGTGLMGTGFGLGAGPLNSYPGQLFPRDRESALVALHTAMGAGFALGPAGVGLLVSCDCWFVFPATLGIASLLVAIASLMVPLPRHAAATRTAGSEEAVGSQGPLVVLALIAVLYALAEGTFSNWAAVYLHDDRGVSDAAAAFAISGFWAGLTLGRLGVSALVARIAPERIWLALPVGMIAVFLILPLVQGPVTGIGAFVLAGLTSSAFFPLTVAIANKRYEGLEARVSSLLVAALMVGVGGGSFLLGVLRSNASLPTLYRISAAYPALALALGAGLLFTHRRLTIQASETPT